MWYFTVTNGMHMKAKPILFILACFCGVYSSAQLPVNHFVKAKQYATSINLAKDSIVQLMQREKIPGLSICISKDFKTVWSAGFGFADLENAVPVNSTSMFRIGSLSKALTAIAIGKLLQEHTLSLNDPVTKYVSYFPAKNYTVTIEQLAHHTAGIRDYDYRNGEYTSRTHYKSVDESIGIFKNDSLLSEPGTKYKYSTYGYVLLSAVVENVARKNYVNYMNDEILKPLQMLHTTIDETDSIIKGRVGFYDVNKNGNIINAYYVDNSNKWGAGGYLSTPEDIAKLANALLQKQFLDDETVATLWKPGKLKDGNLLNYGIGFRINETSDHRTYIHHGGSSIGGRAFLIIYPKEKLVLAVCCNRLASFDEMFLNKICELFLKND